MEGGECTILLAGPDPPPPSLGPCKTVWKPAITAKPIPGSSKTTLAILAALPLETPVAFTSPRAPRLLAADAAQHGILHRLQSEIAKHPVYAVGPRTAAEIRAHLQAEAQTPDAYTVQALAETIANTRPPAILAVRSPQATPTLPETAAQHGIPYVETHAYTIIEYKHYKPPNTTLAAATSARIAAILAKHIPPEKIIAIGPETAKKLPRPPACTANPHTLQGIEKCIQKILTKQT